MPRVERYRSDQISTRPITRVLRQGPVPGQFGEQFGETLTRLGAQGLQVAQEIHEAEQDRANKLTVVTAERQFNQLDDIWLHSKDKGLLTKVGKDPYEALPETRELWEQQAGEIVKAAKTDAQRLALEQMRDRKRAQFLGQAEAHATAEFKAYETGEYKAAFLSAKQPPISAAAAKTLAKLPDGTPVFVGVVRDYLALQESIVRGGGVAIFGGPAQQQALIDQGRSDTHVGVVQALMGADHADVALEYFKEIKDQIVNPAQRAALENDLTQQTREQKAFATANAVYDRLAPTPGDDISPIQLDVMEDALRAEFKTDPKGYDQAVAMLRSRVAGENAGRAARTEQKSYAVWGAVFQGQPIAVVRQLPEYHLLPPKEQHDVARYYRDEADRIENKLYQAESRAAAREGRLAAAENRRLQAEVRDEREKTIRHMATYYGIISDPKVLRAWTPAAILRKQAEWGSEITGKLLNEREQLAKSDAALGNAQLDQQIFVDTAFNAGLTYVRTPPGQQTDEQKANLARLRDTVMGAILYEQSVGRAGRILSDQEKRDVMQRILDNHVLLREWGSDPEVVAALVQEDDAANAYVEYKNIPEHVRRSYINLLRFQGENGTVRTTPLDDQQVINRYTTQMEHAYGARLIGKTLREQDAILRGPAR